MCDPLTIAGTALTAGSIVANNAAQARVNAARNEAIAAESERQRRLDTEAANLVDQSRGRYDNFQTQEGDRSAALGDYFKSDGSIAAPTEQYVPASSSNVVNTETQRQLDKAKSYGDQQASALGELRAFGDLLGGIGRSQARDASQIGTINSFKTGSSNVLPLELQDANNKGGGLRTFGDILGGLGTVATTAGLAGKSLPWFGNAGPPGMYAGGTATNPLTGLRVGGV